MSDSTVHPSSRPERGDDRRPYDPPAVTRHDDWEIVTGSTPSGTS
jgi:hypothetical protein